MSIMNGANDNDIWEDPLQKKAVRLNNLKTPIAHTESLNETGQTD